MTTRLQQVQKEIYPLERVRRELYPPSLLEQVEKEVSKIKKEMYEERKYWG